MGLGLAVPPPDSLPSKANGPKGAKPGVAVPPLPPHSLFKHSCLGKVWQGIPKGMSKVWPKECRAGDPIGEPITGSAASPLGMGGLLLPRGCAAPFPHP